MTWLITDTHFGHLNMVKFCGRPGRFTMEWVERAPGQKAEQKMKVHEEYFTDLIVRNCQVITHEDTVIHLGDVEMGLKKSGRKLIDIMRELPGTWILVRGNHDNQPDEYYLSNGFSLVVNAILYKGVYLTHTPQETLPNGAFLNVHGHYHNNPPENWEFKTQPFHRLLAIEETNYKPVDFEEFVGKEVPAIYR